MKVTRVEKSTLGSVSELCTSHRNSKGDSKHDLRQQSWHALPLNTRGVREREEANSAPKESFLKKGEALFKKREPNPFLERALLTA